MSPSARLFVASRQPHRPPVAAPPPAVERGGAQATSMATVRRPRVAGDWHPALSFLSAARMHPFTEPPSLAKGSAPSSEFASGWSQRRNSPQKPLRGTSGLENPGIDAQKHAAPRGLKKPVVLVFHRDHVTDKASQGSAPNADSRWRIAAAERIRLAERFRPPHWQQHSGMTTGVTAHVRSLAQRRRRKCLLAVSSAGHHARCSSCPPQFTKHDL